MKKTKKDNLDTVVSPPEGGGADSGRSERAVAQRALPKLSVLAFINPKAWAVVTEEAPPRLICEVPDQNNGLRYARLLAAAPDLYEALDNLTDQCCDDPYLAGLVESATAALAKAQGHSARWRLAIARIRRATAAFAKAQEHAARTASPPATSGEPECAETIQVQKQEEI